MLRLYVQLLQEVAEFEGSPTDLLRDFAHKSGGASDNL